MIADEKVRSEAEETLLLFEMDLLFGGVGIVGRDVELEGGGWFEHDGSERDGLARFRVAGDAARLEAV